MWLYFIVAAVYAAYAFRRGTPLTVALGLSMVWPLFMLVGFLNTIVLPVFSKESNDLINPQHGLDECREDILRHINIMLKDFGSRTRSYDDFWNVLIADLNISKAAILQNPLNVPIIAGAFMNVVVALEDVARTVDVETGRVLFRMASKLADSARPATSRLIAIHGRKISDKEAEAAQELISRLRWDEERQDFVEVKPAR